jgi:hypothetical protein
MSKQVQSHLERGEARIVAAPVAPPVAERAGELASMPRHQVDIDRNFELPTGLYKATVGLYLAFLGVLFAGFGGPGLVIPMAICVVFIAGIFGVPAIWSRLKRNSSRPMTMGAFKQAGIMTNTGPVTPKDAAIQMLILPVLIVIWACATVAIAALV